MYAHIFGIVSNSGIQHTNPSPPGHSRLVEVHPLAWVGHLQALQGPGQHSDKFIIPCHLHICHEVPKNHQPQQNPPLQEQFVYCVEALPVLSLSAKNLPIGW